MTGIRRDPCVHIINLDRHRGLPRAAAQPTSNGQVSLLVDDSESTNRNTSHRRLGEDLLSLGGALVSEYPPGTPPGWLEVPATKLFN
jgi:hypothetical protein